MIAEFVRKQPTVIRNALQACRRHFVYALLFSALLNLLFIAPMLYMLQVYDRVVPTYGATTLLFLTLVLLFALIVLSGLDALRSRLLVRASVRLDKELAGAILESTLAVPDQGAQRIAKQALREFDVLRQTLTGPSMVALFDAPWVPIYIAIAWLIDPWIGILALAGAAISVYLAWRNERATNARLKEANAAAGRSYAGYEFTLAQADVVRALGQRRAMVAGHLSDRHSMMELQSLASLESSGIGATSKFVRLAVQSLALGLAALLAIDNRISAGAIFASSFIVGRALAPIDQLVGSWKMVVQGMNAWGTLQELFAESRPDVSLTRLPPPEGKLSTESLTIIDQNRRPILQNVTFSASKGETIAIIGPSGAGKSTLVKALAGAAIPVAGLIRFDGADQKNWDPELLAEHIGYMPQEASLFAGTIKENIARFRNRLGANAMTLDAAVIDAARKARAHDLILQLPGGYDYTLGLGGRGLSAGQAQRIALARALFGSPQYLILDEPNASLDAEGDQQLIQTLDEAKKSGVTTLIVAHRLSVLPIIDKIMVIQDGRLTAMGARDEVLAQLAPPKPPQAEPDTATAGKRGR
ncbi:MAG: type I secretion system permease/ATPase [Sphingomicrobium sp.]